MATTHIIYVPGLGDSYDGVRATALKTWKRRGLSVEFVPMKWRSTTESYDDKVKKVTDAIDRATADTIVLVGESAGGSVVTAIGYTHNHVVSKVITIFGKNVKTNRVSPYLYKKNPAFKDSMLQADSIVESMSVEDASQYVNVYSPYDPTIRKIDTHIPGATLRRVHTPGHLISISLVLTVLQHIVIREARR